MLKRCERVDVAGCSSPSCPERRTNRESRSVHDRAGKDRVSRRKSSFCQGWEE